MTHPLPTPPPGGNPLACYDRRFMLSVIAAATGLILLSALSKGLGLERGSIPRIGIGAAQALLIGYAIFITVSSIRKLDELQYRIHLEAVAISFAASAMLTTGWGFLSKAGWPSVEWGLWIWPVMVVFWGLGVAVVRRQYR